MPGAFFFADMRHAKLGHIFLLYNLIAYETIKVIQQES